TPTFLPPGSHLALVNSSLHDKHHTRGRRGMRTLFRKSAFVGVMSAVLTAGMVALALPAAAPDAPAAYSPDSPPRAHNQGWMGWLANNAPLSTLTLPGTHDSGASRAGGDPTLTQSMTLSAQLMAGIRAWDIRLDKAPDGKLRIAHGIIPQGQD